MKSVAFFWFVYIRCGAAFGVAIVVRSDLGSVCDSCGCGAVVEGVMIVVLGRGKDATIFYME